jgi:hypothetical protein
MECSSKRQIPSLEFLQEQQRQRQQLQQEQERRRQQQLQQGHHEQQPSRARSSEPDEAAPEGETEAAYLMRRAREFNVATRERPEDLQMWLDFAAFQDEALARCTTFLFLPPSIWGPAIVDNSRSLQQSLAWGVRS